jgi:predicted O-linked N-acetylglucosamine transferase (SPINDLY family)
MPQSTHQKIVLADRYFRAGQIPLCEDLLRQVIGRSKAVSKAYELLAYICGNRGQLEECEELLLEASRLPGCSAEALFYLGKAQLQRGQVRAALKSFRRAVAWGDFFEAWHETGVAYSALGDHERALAAFRRAQHIDGDSPVLHANIARTLAELARFDEALRHCDRAIASNPELVRAWVERGLALAELGDRPQALQSFDRALALAPQDSGARMARASVLARLGRHDEALAAHADIAKLPPDTGYERGHWLYNAALMCRWAAWGPMVADTLARVRAGEKAAVPFSLLATPACPATLLACARTYARDQCPTREPAPPIAPRPSSLTKLRVGYFSSDFRNHATSQLMVRLFECHDRARFEWFGFSVGPTAPDPMTQRVAAAFDRFVECADRSDAQIARLARSEGIDIAIDLNGFTEGARPCIFAHRAAPVQVNYLGFPATMGCDFIDYIIADATLIRPDEYRHYAEKVVTLPGCYQANDQSKAIADAPPTRAAMGLPPQRFVFACFNNSYKITPDVFEVWMRLLRRVPGSVLWLLRGSDAAVAGIEAEAVARGVEASRIIWAERLPPAEHLARHTHADLFLDTFHYNAHTTCSDALWAGLPVLTLAGRTFASRVAASLLNTMGLPELVTRSVDAYEAAALSLASSPETLAGLRRRLACGRTETPLFDTPLFARRIEAAFAAMGERHRLGLPPDHIRVGAGSC